MSSLRFKEVSLNIMCHSHSSNQSFHPGSLTEENVFSFICLVNSSETLSPTLVLGLVLRWY